MAVQAYDTGLDVVETLIRDFCGLPRPVSVPLFFVSDWWGHLVFAETRNERWI